MNEPLLELRGIRKRHSAAFQLSVDALSIPAAEVFALLGPTGAGKSTLLRIVAGLTAADEGTVRLCDTPFDASDAALATRRRIAMVFQRPLLLNSSVWANVESGLRWRAIRDRRPRVETALRQLKLLSLAEQLARTLSGGQMQLVAVARALVLEPDVLVLDEPTANLDPAHVALVEEVIAETHRRRDATIIWTTHNLFQARRVAERVGLLLDGQLVEVAATDDFFNRPADPRTAAFVAGRMVY